MKLFNIISNTIKNEILKEASMPPDKIYQKYYQDRFSREDFNKIVMSDPGTIVKDGDIRKIGRYSKLLLSWVENGTLKMEDLANATEYLGFVYKHNIPVDSKEINGIGKLFKLVKKYIITKDSDFYSILAELPKNEYIKMFENEKWVIYVPRTERAACHLGVGTRWCTTWGKESLDTQFKDRDNRFLYYTSKGDFLYIIVNKDDPKEKYQFEFKSDQYMDKNDSAINVSRFLTNNPDILKFFFQGVEEKLPIERFDVERKRLNILSGEYLKSFVLNNISNFEGSDRLLSLIQSKCGELVGYVDKINIIECDDNIRFTIDGDYDRENILDPDDNAYDSDNYRYWSILSSEYAYTEQIEIMILDHTYEFKNYKFELLKAECPYVEWLRLYYLELYKADITKIPGYSNIIMKLLKTSISEELTDAAMELTYETYYGGIEQTIDNIDDYLSIIPHRNHVEISIPKMPFVMFINEHKSHPDQFTTVDDTFYLISEYFIDYVLKKFDLESMVYSFYRLIDLPKEKFFEIYEKYLEENGDPFFDLDCDEMEEFRLFLEKNFQFDDRENVYYYKREDPNSGKSISIIINEVSRLCDNGKINVKYTGLNGESKTGDIDFRSLLHYMNNYKLFEEVLNFNRYII